MDLPNWALKSNEKSNRWCKRHPESIWGKNPYTGKYYERCYKGRVQDEKCVIGNKEVEE